MTVPTTIDAAGWLSKYLESGDADTDLPRAMLQAFAEALMSAQASMQCGAGYGERTEERENSRNGYRQRPWGTRVGTIRGEEERQAVANDVATDHHQEPGGPTGSAGPLRSRRRSIATAPTRSLTTSGWSRQDRQPRRPRLPVSP